MSLLRGCDMVAILPTDDLASAKEFYKYVLGLNLVSEDALALVFEAHGTRLRVVNLPGNRPTPYTAVGWIVRDIDLVVVGADRIAAHQNPLGGNLCLLARGSHNWDPAWLAANVPPPWSGALTSENRDDHIAYLRKWQRTLFEGGWAGIAWPTVVAMLALGVGLLARTGTRPSNVNATGDFRA